MMDGTDFGAGDRKMGAALNLWVDQNASWLPGLTIRGPLPAPGMDPTWIVHLDHPRCHLEMQVLRGPFAFVGWFDPTQPDPELHQAGLEVSDPAEVTALLDQAAQRLAPPLLGT